MKTIKFKVTGMHCGSCAQLITMELSEVEGITGVMIDQTSGMGSATLIDDKLSSVDVVAAVERAGYKATIA